MAKCLLSDHYLFLSLFVLARALVSFGNVDVSAAFFGDSILDAGNNHFNKNCTVQADFPPYGQDFFHQPTGRLTNGRTVPDFISEYLGVDLQKPYLEVDMLVKSGKLKNYPANGINFASAGSGVMKETNQGMGVIPLKVQLQQFEDLVKQNKIDKNPIKQALYVFETRSNDVFFYFLSLLDHQLDPDNYINMMLSEFQQAIQRLYGLGARKIAIFGLGPVGCIPARLFLPNTSVDQCHSKMNEMVVKYNLGLEAIVNQIPAKLHGAIGVYADTLDVVSLFLRFPQHYGELYNPDIAHEIIIRNKAMQTFFIQGYQHLSLSLMGNTTSCTPYITSIGSIKIIDMNGTTKEYKQSIKATEIMLENPGQFICDSTHLKVGCRVPGLSGEEELRRQHLYFLLPMDMLFSVLTEEEMLTLSFMATRSKKRGSKKIARIIPMLTDFLSSLELPPEPASQPETNVKLEKMCRQWSWRPSLDTIEELS
ncbi:hypothetical protein J5N97_007494 [Dioscorea zingiberensis]|uniref:GDSL esterase/lipase n=1 Tax=Dioscorea zingiberensis TaxID=325984 RepID=A0A9D5DDJ6_9LILI|nr:hypothetical protein J5N97_007494 [Dioscorea zingiberensis]